MRNQSLLGVNQTYRAPNHLADERLLRWLVVWCSAMRAMRAPCTSTALTQLGGSGTQRLGSFQVCCLKRTSHVHSDQFIEVLLIWM
jgi:hypothetical protein